MCIKRNMYQMFIYNPFGRMTWFNYYIFIFLLRYRTVTLNRFYCNPTALKYFSDRSGSLGKSDNFRNGGYSSLRSWRCHGVLMTIAARWRVYWAHGKRRAHCVLVLIALRCRRAGDTIKESQTSWMAL